MAAGDARHALGLDALLARRARAQGGRVWLESAETGARLTFAEVDAAASRVAHLLAARGVPAGQPVSILADNCPAFVVLFLGILRHGAVVNPVNVEVNAKNLAQILHDVAPGLIFCHGALPPDLAEAARAAGAPALTFGDVDLEPLLAGIPARPYERAGGRPDDTAVIDYTSGTTDRPKGVCIGAEPFSLMSASPAERFGFTEHDRVLEYRSLAWASPQLLGVGGTLHAGATLVLGRRFSHHRFFDWIREHGVTIAAGLPTVVAMLLDRPLPVTARDVPTLNFLTSSAAPLDAERQLEFEDRYGIPIVQGCGMTEAGWMAGNPPAARRPGSIGPAMPHLRAWFTDDDGRPCPPGREGQLVVGGPQMASAYLVDRGRREPIAGDGFATGDLGHLDGDGYLYITGRKKDLIIKGGVNIAPREITSVLLAHAGVADAATIGVPDAVYGETIACFVVARAGHRLTAADVLAHCRERLAPFKIPAGVEVVDAIPKTARGKVSAEALRRLWPPPAPP